MLESLKGLAVVEYCHVTIGIFDVEEETMYKILVISTLFNQISGCSPVEELKAQIQYLEERDVAVCLLLDPSSYELEKTIRNGDFFCAYTTTMYSYHNVEDQILAYQYNIIQLLEYYGVPVVGSDFYTQLFINDKYLCGVKSGICPEIWLITRNACIHTAEADWDFIFPIILKPNTMSGSCGIGQDSIVYDKDSLFKQAAVLFQRFPQLNEIVAEKYMASSTEYTISVLGNGDHKLFSITKLQFHDPQKHYYSEQDKNLPLKERNVGYCLEEDETICHQLKYHADRLFNFFKLRDFARFDFLFDHRCYLIDCNALPVQGNSFSWEWQQHYGLKKQQVLALLLCEFHYRRIASGKPDSLPKIIIESLPKPLITVLASQMPLAGFPESTVPSSYCPKVGMYTMVDRISAETEVLILLKALVIALKPDFILETGTYHGATALAMLQGLSYNEAGKLVTLEYDSNLAAHIQERIQDERIVIVNTSSLEYIPEAPIDFLYLDSSRPIRIKEFWHYKPYLSENAIIVWHDSAPEHDCVYQDINTLVRDGIIDRVLLPTPRGLTISKLRFKA